MSKTGVLLVNLGTPGSAKPSDVKKYLLEFLTDERVIDMPWLRRNLLVRGIIVPFRYKKSAKIYESIWTDEMGSPLLYHSTAFLEKVKKTLPEDVQVELAMRYQKPTLAGALESFRKNAVDKIVIFPLFPQYASSTTGSIHQKVMDIVSKWMAVPEISFIPDFYDDPGFISAFANRINHHDPDDYDHVLFSYHGLPERHLKKNDLSGSHCLQEHYKCCNEMVDTNRFCYRAQCIATTKALAQTLNLSQDRYTVCFQSRLGRDPWIQPYTGKVLELLAGQGKKRVLVVCPAFVADCLETIYEISVEYQEEFEAVGGKKVQLVESLNDSNLWVKAATDLIIKRFA
ncbi:MAG: ferrochelatase [Bacteroidetes bacterium]|nr:ferrochelatase [Bacteroidota bacterium]